MAIIALHDSDERLKTKWQAMDITDKIKDLSILEDTATRANKKGYGIFWVVNDFEGARKKENLTKINYWYCDIDGGDKKSQMEKIDGLQLPPTFIVETKNGYHCYWAVKGEASIDNFEAIEIAIVERLGGDIHCKDVLRMLRCPGYYHMKDPENPFFCDIVWDAGSNQSYTEEQMINYFLRNKRNNDKIIKFKPDIKCDKNDFLDKNKWERIFKISSLYKGCRNSKLAQYTFWMRDEGLTSSEIEYVINGINDSMSDPLSKSEVASILRGKI